MTWLHRSILWLASDMNTDWQKCSFQIMGNNNFVILSIGQIPYEAICPSWSISYFPKRQIRRDAEKWKRNLMRKNWENWICLILRKEEWWVYGSTFKYMNGCPIEKKTILNICFILSSKTFGLIPSQQPKFNIAWLFTFLLGVGRGRHISCFEDQGHKNNLATD